MTPKEFRELLEPHARKVEAETGIPWQVMCAQVALRLGGSNTCQQTEIQDSHPITSLTSKVWTCRAVEINTTEYINGKRLRLSTNSSL